MKIPKLNGKQVFSRLGLLLASLAIYALLFGLWPRYFDIEWDEQVKLHDGRVIVVHVKRTYERRGHRLERFPENPGQISMTFRFSIDRDKYFEHTFVRGTLHFLDEMDGKWYIGYHADGADPSVEIGTRELYPHVAIVNSNGTIQKPKSWDEVPYEIKSANILPVTPNPKVAAKFHGSLLTIQEKINHWKKYPTGAGWGIINRISSKSNN